ncbi:MAG TPA: DUF1801 domain-containing protein [Dehalococcoidia bacterium]|jgi:uncharacterized protein YdhG (YjbR/CyaY superfamily)|nr:DUF1801 domain-containing protein [Dehalococcoidia bacterium]
MNPPASVDAYIAKFPPEVQERLQTIRRTVAKAAPGATERTGYGMPGFFLRKNVVYFAAFKHHIGFFPGTEALESFADDLAGFKTSKGGVQFPHDKRLPLGLIAKIVKFRVRQQRDAAAPKPARPRSAR